MGWFLIIAGVALIAFGIIDWSIQGRLAITRRDPGKKEVKVGSLKVLD